MLLQTTIETPKQLFSKQVIVPDWMMKACRDAEKVEVTRQMTGFGTYVIAIKPVRNPTKER